MDAAGNGTIRIARNLAVVIGINDYAHSLAPLKNARWDAIRVAELLANKHRYTLLPSHPDPVLDQKATDSEIRKLLEETLPAVVQPTDRLLFYFAGHGKTLDGKLGREGYIRTL